MFIYWFYLVIHIFNIKFVIRSWFREEEHVMFSFVDRHCYFCLFRYYFYPLINVLVKCTSQFILIHKESKNINRLITSSFRQGVALYFMHHITDYVTYISSHSQLLLLSESYYNLSSLLRRMIMFVAWNALLAYTIWCFF